MATRKTKAAEPAEEIIPENDVQDAETEAGDTAEIDPKDAEIARLKAMLEKANQKAAYNSPREELARLRVLAEDAAKENMDPWKIEVEIRVPRRPRTEDPWYWVNINGRSAQIPADDKIQKMKLPFALVIEETLAAEEAAQDYADSLEVKDPVNNPH